MGGLDISSSEIKVIKELFSWKRGQSFSQKLDQYVYQTFDAFLKHKKQIVIDLYQLGEAKTKDMIDLILYSLEKGTKERSYDDKTNLLRSETIGIFTNVKKVVIDTWDNYCISLAELLSLVSKTEWEQVI
eukprot:383034_1